MEAISCLISRRSVREYTREPLSQQEIENVVETSQMASCWENTQPIRYIAVLDEDLKNRIADECTKKFPWNTENIHEIGRAHPRSAGPHHPLRHQRPLRLRTRRHTIHHKRHPLAVLRRRHGSILPLRSSQRPRTRHPRHGPLRRSKNQRNT